MIAALVRRLVLVPVTVLGVTLVTFLVLHLVPGDAAQLKAGTARGASAEELVALRHAFELDRPLGVRYLSWLGRSLVLDFGASSTDGRPVRDKVAERLPATLALALFAAALSYGLALPIGCALALGEGRRWARLTHAALALGYALPAAAVGLILVAAGAPYGGGGAILAAGLCLSIPAVARLGRHQRGALLGALRSDYVRAAVARGAGPRVAVGHALRNSLLSTVTLLSAELPALLSGSVIVEQIFGLRGLGTLALDAVVQRDQPVLLGLVTLAALLSIGATVLADLAYGLCDPRLRRGALDASGPRSSSASASSASPSGAGGAL